MGKYEKKTNGRGFVRGLVIYTVVIMAAIAVGLAVLWDFLKAYEESRPQTALDQFVQQLAAGDFNGQSLDVMDEIDHKIQSEEECRELIQNQLSGEITYAKNVAACTEEKWVYVLRHGSKIVGNVSLIPRDKDRYGFSNWEISSGAADFSMLKGEKLSVTVPSNFSVSVNGVTLDRSYITEDQIQYPELKEFYDNYQLPYLVTYEAGPFLGDLKMEVTDSHGAAVSMDENTDLGQFLNNCTAEEQEKIQEFADIYIKLLVAYGGSTSQNGSANFNRLAQYMVRNGELANRFRSALPNYQFSQNRGNKVVSQTINRMVNIGENRYLCDVTYLVDTNGKQGVVRTTNNVKIILIAEKSRLLAEAMTSY